MSILMLLTQPIGEKVYNVANKNINTIINNSGLNDAQSNGKFSTITFIYKYDTGSEIEGTKNVIKARTETVQRVTHPQIPGYIACAPGTNPATQGQQPAEEFYAITDESQVITIYYYPISYTVEYDCNGGMITGEYVTSYSHGTSFSLPIDVVKQGYKFVGWFEDAGLGGRRIYSVPATDSGNKKFYAKFAIL